MADSSPPSMSASFLFPVYDALSDTGVSEAEMARQLSATGAQMRDPATMLPANLIYGFLSWASERAGDVHFSARCGRSMGRGHWAPVLPLFQASQSVGEFLQRFSAMAASQGGSASYRLEVEGTVALWRLIRPAKSASQDSAQADAMSVGFFGEILKQASGANWSPEAIVAVIGEPGRVPTDLLPVTSVMGGKGGMSLRFPAEYLNRKLVYGTQEPLPEPVLLPVVTSFPVKEKVRDLVFGNLRNRDYGIDDIASALGLKRWRLQAILAAEGTNVATLKSAAREAAAIELLQDRANSVASIASELGYANRANFSRAMQGWTGLSPSNFRKKHQKQ